MTDERRYSEDEVAAIFAKATEVREIAPGSAPPAEGSGMTLAELQEVGLEAGISPDAVAHAAFALDRPEVRELPRRRFLGLPLGVGRVVDLGRSLSDEEWDRLVVDLRETFDAKGRLSSDGSFRQWTNGNLHAMVEPAEGHHQLRLKTLNGLLREVLIAGTFAMGMSAALLLIGFSDPRSGVIAAVMGAAGFGVSMIGGLRLKRWARARERQFEEIAARWATADPRTVRHAREPPTLAAPAAEEAAGNADDGQGAPGAPRPGSRTEEETR